MAVAIKLLEEHFLAQPSSRELAEKLALRPQQFQRLFRQWTGLSPKQFLQIFTVERAKLLLSQQHNCLDTTMALGLSSGGRLHEQVVTLEAVTPGELKSGGQGLTISTGCGKTPLGPAQVTWTQRGIHTLRFKAEESNTAERDHAHTQSIWPHAHWQESPEAAQQWLNRIFQRSPSNKHAQIQLWVTGTNFQIAVWRALLSIPEGNITSYGHLSAAIGNPKASRAVGHAVGSNPVATLIPCHRVIRATGALGGYRWGLETKRILLAKELFL